MLYRQTLRINSYSIMKQFFISFLCIVIIVIGCSSTRNNPISKTPNYNIIADNSFNINHKIDIAAALEEWNAKTNNTLKYNLTFVDTTELKKSTDVNNTIYIISHNPGIGLLGWTAWDERVNGAYMYIMPGIDNDTRFSAVVLHELGHAFHLVHYTLPNLSIMHPVVLTDTAHLECTDITAFCKEWECTTDCSIQPELKTQNISIVVNIIEKTCGIGLSK